MFKQFTCNAHSNDKPLLYIHTNMQDWSPKWNNFQPGYGTINIYESICSNLYLPDLRSYILRMMVSTFQVQNTAK